MKPPRILIIAVAASIALACSTRTNAAVQGKHLFILSGQSNMAALDPDISFIPAVTAEFGKNNVIIVKDAANGQSIRRWHKKQEPATDNNSATNGDLYNRLMEKVAVALKSSQIQTVTFIWMQGESDAEQNGAGYADSLNGLLDQLKTDLGRNDINVVIGRISDYANFQRFPQWEMIRNAQVEVADSDPKVVWVDTDDLNSGTNQKGEMVENDLHYSVEGYKILGKRFAEKAIELIRCMHGN